MQQNLKNLIETLDEFVRMVPVPARYNLQHNFDICSELAKDISNQNQSLILKDVFKLISLEQDGSYPPEPNVDAARVGVHLIWHLSKNPKLLFKLIKLKASPWYVKVEALKCLRLVQKNVIHWSQIMKVIKSQSLDNEVKIAALDTIVFHDAGELVSELEKIQPPTSTSDYFGSRLYERILYTRAKLGDPKTTLEILELCNASSFFTQQSANEALSQLAQKNGGYKNIASGLLSQSNIVHHVDDNIWLSLQNHDNQAVIIWALSQASVSKRQTQKCLDFLSHPEWKVKRSASKWLSENIANTDILLNFISNRDHEIVSKSWAAYTILEIDPSSAKHLNSHLNEQGVFHKQWPFEAPENVRSAIVNEYASINDPGTDIRYMLETKLKSKNEKSSNFPPPYTTPLEVRLALVEVLENNGIKVSTQQSAGEFYGQGGGNYWALTLEKVERHNLTILFVSDLGGFIARDISWFESDNSYSDIDQGLSPQSKARIKLCEKIITENGFIWLNEDLLHNTVPDLVFGRHRNNTVASLLFHWDS